MLRTGRVAALMLRERQMPVTPTPVERAFEMARSGRFATLREIKAALRKDGYSSDQIFGPTLSKQIYALIREAAGEKHMDEGTRQRE